MIIRQKLLLLSFLILFANVILGYAVYKSNQRLNNSEQWVRHTEQVIYQSGNILSVAKDIEIASRGFVITHDSTFLVPLYSAEKGSIIYIRQLRQLVSDSPGQQQRIDSLNFYMRKRLDFSFATVELRNKKGLAAAIVFISTRQGKYYSDHIRDITTNIQQVEGILLKQRKETNGASAAMFNRYLGALFVLMAAFSILLLITINKYFFQNEEKGKRAEELVIANEELLFQNKEKEKRAAELVIANEELLFQNLEKGKRAEELIIANANLVFQNKEKGKRAAELVIANAELSFQNEEKGKRATELAIANIELSFQNEEKETRAAELKKATYLYAFISQVNQDIVRVKDQEVLFRNACRIALEFGKFKIAWIGLFIDENKRITLAEQIGIPAEDVEKFKNVPLKVNGPQANILLTSKYYICNDIENDLELESWWPLAKKERISSCMILPIKKSGSTIGTFNLYAAEPNFFKDKEIAMMAEMAGDISFALEIFEKEKKQKAAEELVLINEKRFRALIEKSADMITLANENGELIYGSPYITNVLGYSDKELINKSIFDIIHPDDIQEFIKNRNKLLNTPGKTFYFRHRRLRKNGSWIWCEGSFTNMLHEPAVKAIVSNFRDITEQKIREEQKQFDRNNLNALINNTTDLMWSVDNDFNLITSNVPFDQSVKLLSGKTIKKGTSIMSTSFPSEQLVQYKNFYERAFAGEAFKEVVYNTLPVEFWSEISFFPIRKGDQVIGTACHSSDITKKMKTEQELIKSEMFNRGVLNSLVSHIAVIDKTGTIIAVNESWDRFAGENGELDLQQTGIGSNYFKVCNISARAGEKIAAEALIGMKEVMDEKKTDFYLEYPCDSLISKRWFGMRAMRFGSGEQMIVVSHQDISERKLAEENVLQSESRLKEAQAITHIGNFEIDLVNNAEIWSDEMYKIYGITKNATVSTELFLSFMYPDDLDYMRAGIEKNFKNLLSSSFNFRFIRRDGALRYGYSEAKFEFDKDQKPIRLYGVVQDVTKTKLAEIERTKMANDMMLRNNDLEQFAYIISHNLRAPLANIIGASSVLNDPELSVEEKQILNKGINTSVMRLDDVVKDLNQILQIKGDINETKEIVNFSELVDDIKISINNLIVKYRVEVRCDFSQISEFLTVKGYLYSIFYNLISNSIKYRRQQIACVINIKSLYSKSKIELIFIDNGMGIDLEKNGGDVFGLYKRFHTNIEGKGMGLFMVKTQVETLGGKISIKSHENAGTEFKIEFEI